MAKLEDQLAGSQQSLVNTSEWFAHELDFLSELHVTKNGIRYHLYDDCDGVAGRTHVIKRCPVCAKRRHEENQEMTDFEHSWR